MPGSAPHATTLGARLPPGGRRQCAQRLVERGQAAGPGRVDREAIRRAVGLNIGETILCCQRQGLPRRPQGKGLVCVRAMLLTKLATEDYLYMGEAYALEEACTILSDVPCPKKIPKRRLPEPRP